MSYRLLTEFESLFAGKMYLHRNSRLGDSVALNLYEDLVALNKSIKFTERVETKEWVLNTANERRGIKARRGDGTFGEIVPGEKACVEAGYSIARGCVATIEIGIEIKILQKAMMKQIDRVVGDLRKQVDHFRRRGGQPVCIAVVGINHAQHCTSYEGTRSFTTDGRTHRHPIQEAEDAERRLFLEAAPKFDEFIVLRYRATNEPPFQFTWVDYEAVAKDYGSALLRVCREYDRRF